MDTAAQNTTDKKNKNPIEQKSKLIEQLKEIESKIAQFDKQRSDKIASLAKKHHLVDLSDDLLEKEFKIIRDKYKKEHDATLSKLDGGKKNS